MDRIAKESGFSRSLLYVYFKDKKDIYDALRKRAGAAMRKRMQDYVQDDSNGLENVVQVGRAFFDFYRYNPDYFHCLSLNISLNNQTSINDSDICTELSESENSTMQILVNALQKGLSDGSIDATKVNNPLETAMFLRGSLHGIILLQDDSGSKLLKNTKMDSSALLDYSIDRITDALKTH